MGKQPTMPDGWKTSLKMDDDIEDAGKRMADVMNLHITFGKPHEIRDKYVAISLADGRSDGHLYDTKREAVRHQAFEQQYYYAAFRGINPGGVNWYECAVALQFQRDAYNAGLRLTDPDDHLGGRQAIMGADDRADYSAMSSALKMREYLKGKSE